MIDFNKACAEIEKNVKTYVGNEVAEMRVATNRKVADEMQMTVASMYLARTIAQIHVDNGEPLDKVSARAEECVTHHVRVLMKKYMEVLKQGEKRGARHSREKN